MHLLEEKSAFLTKKFGLQELLWLSWVEKKLALFLLWSILHTAEGLLVLIIFHLWKWFPPKYEHLAELDFVINTKGLIFFSFFFFGSTTYNYAYTLLILAYGHHCRFNFSGVSLWWKAHIWTWCKIYFVNCISYCCPGRSFLRLCSEKTAWWFSTWLGNIHNGCCYCFGSICKFLFIFFSLDSKFHPDSNMWELFWSSICIVWEKAPKKSWNSPLVFPTLANKLTIIRHSWVSFCFTGFYSSYINLRTRSWYNTSQCSPSRAGRLRREYRDRG